VDGNLAYGACGLLIVIYAWGRFNTPPSNRSSTSQKLYWSSCAGYVLSALAVFVALVILLKSGPWRQILIPSGDNASLPVPLVATLAMTTLLPSLPMLKRVDEWFLAIFLDWAEIPGEVKRRAAGLTPESFQVTREDVVELREAYGDGSYGNTLADHLRQGSGEGLELSQCRFTRVVKLHHRINKLAGASRYSDFFVESDQDWTELDRKTSDFLRRSAVSLSLAERLRAVDNAEAYEELVEERRQQFAQSCQEIFRALALFLARAVLRSEASEKDILRRLRDIGFAAAEPMNLPRFPINSLTGLALGVFIYLVLAIPFFGQVMGMSDQQTGGLTTAAKVTLVRLLTVGVTVWLLQRYAFFRREPGEPLRFFAYVVNGIIAAVVAAGICLAFHLGDPDPWTASHGDLPLILLSFLLCTAVAACCDDWVEDKAPPVWWRFAEAAGCALVMAAGMGIIMTYLGETLPPPLRVAALPAWKIALLVTMPSALALVIGACVPHIYRSAWRAATARRQQASAPDAVAAAVPADAGTHDAAPGTVIALVASVPKRKGTKRPAPRQVRVG
jgi:hypothetical protein